MSDKNTLKTSKDASVYSRIVLLLFAVLMSAAVKSVVPDEIQAVGDHKLDRVLVIDSAVVNYNDLLSDADLNNTKVVIIRKGESPLRSIRQALEGQADIQSLHIVTHGSVGELLLAGQSIDLTYLQKHRLELNEWSNHLSSEADIFLYGCDIAQGAAGQAFLEELSLLTSADIAASINKTGHQGERGDWVLESHLGDVNSKIFFSKEVQHNWSGVLAVETLYTITDPASTGNTVGGQATWVMNDTGSGTPTVDWRATIVSTDTTVEFDLRPIVGANNDAPYIVNEAAGTTVIRWEAFELGTTTPRAAELCLTMSDLDGLDHIETLTVNKADLFNYTLSAATNITVVDNGISLSFFGATEDDDEDDAVKLCFKERDTWDMTLKHTVVAPETGGFIFGAANHFSFVGGTTVNILPDLDGDGIPNVTENNCGVDVPIFTENFGAGSRTSTLYIDGAYCYEDGTASCFPTVDVDDGQYAVARNPNEVFLNGGLGGVWHDDPDHTTGDVDGRMLIVNADVTPGEFYRRTVSGLTVNTRYGFNSWFANIAIPPILSEVPINFTMKIEDLSGNQLDSFNTGDYYGTAGAMVWVQAALSFNTGVNTSVQIVIVNNGLGGDGNDIAIDDIEITGLTCDLDSDGVTNVVDLDSDNDGVPDSIEAGSTPSNPVDTDSDIVFDAQDLDSDNDGIYDLIEAGHGQADVNTNGVIDNADTGSGANGLFDALETADDYTATLNYTITDTDSNGNEDFSSSDADGDACSDVLEAGFIDQNLDDYLGDVPLSVDGNGVVTGAAGYTVPNANYINNGIASACVPSFSFAITGGNNTVTEAGTTDTFDVVLGSQPSSNVVINISSDDTGEATVLPASLIFTPSNWTTAQTVTIMGENDALVDGTQSSTITLSINDALSDNNFDLLADQTTSVDTLDDDTASFTVTESGGTTVVAEGSAVTDSFTVVLDREPVGTVVINVSSGDTGEAMVDQATLTFLVGDWNVAQTVNVSSVNDAVVDGAQNTTITLSINDGLSDDGYDPVADQTATTTTNDDEVAGFTIVESGGSISVTEGSAVTDSFTVVLNDEPLGSVVINVSSGDTGEATVDQASLTFLVGDWNVAQTVTVSSANDGIVDGAQNTTITLSVNDAVSDDGYDPVADQTVTATTNDDDTASFTVTESGGTTVVTEGSAVTDSFTVVLDSAPAGTVVIDVSSGDTGEATVDQASLTFLVGDWNVAQTVNVSSANDAIVDGAQNTTITMSVNDAASDDGYDPVADQTVTATTNDDDSAGFTVTESAGTTVVTEGSAVTDNFTVVLDREPAGTVVINVSSGDTGEATVDQATLTFLVGDWNVAQTVNVSSVNDAVVDGAQNTTITLSINDGLSDDGYDPVADQTATTTTNDDEVAGFTIVESGGSISVTEGSAVTDSFTVVLNDEPLGSVVINVSSGDTGEATVDQASLTFLVGDWNVAQTVTVSSANDGIVDGAQNTTITLSVNDAVSDDGYDPVADQTVTATTNDDDTASFTVTESGGTTVVTEGSAVTDSFTVVLDSAPAGTVVIDVSSGDTGEATVDQASLTFLVGDWNVAQTVNVSSANDAIVDGVQNTTITLSINDAASDDGYDPVADQTVTATTNDDDTASFTVTESGSTIVAEGNVATDSFTVVLDQAPAGTVVINVSSGDTGEATVDQASLTFLVGDWNVAQMVNVSSVDDAVVDGAQNTTITLSINDAASDDGYDPVADQTVTATTNDDDSAGFTVMESAGTTVVAEGSAVTDSFTVVLDQAPAGTVVIDVSSGDTGEATVDQASLTFLVGDWNVAQTVNVSSANDAIVDGAQNTTITLSINDAASDDGYDPVADQTVTVTTNDDDTASFTVTESGGTTVVTEGSAVTDSFTVVLDSAPAGTVVIDVSSGDTGEATVDQASLTFLVGDWSVAQTVNVSSANDAIVDGVQNTTITLSINDAASDDGYDPVADQTVTAITNDDETADFAVIESAGSTLVSEAGSTDTFDVALTIAPVTNVVIDVSSGDTAEVTVDQASLTFMPGNWNVVQTVTVTGVDDALLDGNQNTTITLSINDAASDDAFDPLADKTVVAATVDDEAIRDDDKDGIPNIVEGVVDTDTDGTPDYQDIDSDNDGIPDGFEESNIPPLSGADADFDGLDNVIDVDFTGGNDFDFDGIDDALEPTDSDGDATPNHLDPDSDNDGIPDGLEADDVPVLADNDADTDGVDDALDVDLVGGVDANNNGIRDSFEPRDTDSDGIRDFLDVDSDNDGILDGTEADVAGVDTDVDGIDDQFDVDQTFGVDADGDGVDDATATDTDNDGRPDFRELDSDNDAVPDVMEAGLTDNNQDGFSDGGVTTATPAASDGDGIDDYRDLDSDADTIFDIVATGQTAFDLDANGQIDPAFFADADLDGVPNLVDSVPTVFGLANDPDGDGVSSGIDLDDDNDGILDSIESPGAVDIDSDGDGIVDRLDRDSDNDGLPDSVEAFNSSDLDTNYNGVIDDLSDADNNGLSDSVSTGMVPVDTDADGSPDYLDSDSDNDGLNDLLELTLENVNSFDTDLNGVLDSTMDTDGDGLADIVDSDNGGAGITPPDSDADGIANFRDTDSDNDGFSDKIENGDYNENNTLDAIENGGGIETGGGGCLGVFFLWLLCLGLRIRRKQQ